MATIADTIITELDKQNEIKGARHIAFEVLRCENRAHVNRTLQKLEAAGEITIIRSCGRGHKNIYRRNRNSPGYRRKVRHS